MIWCLHRLITAMQVHILGYISYLFILIFYFILSSMFFVVSTTLPRLLSMLFTDKKTNPLRILRSCVKSLRHPAGSNMAASRLEINFIRLLSRCESIASEKRGETEWRLDKVTLNDNVVYSFCSLRSMSLLSHGGVLSCCSRANLS